MVAVPAIAVPAWPNRLIAAFDASDERARELLAGLKPDQLNWQPQPGAWSIGQCLEHLCVANEVYLPAITAALANRPVSPAEEIAPGWFGRWFIRNYIDPSPQTRRARAPKKILPRAQVELSVLDRFLRTNHSARELVRQAGKHDVNSIRFVNPFIPLLRFTVGTGLEILARHQGRHLLQAERVRQSTGFPR